MKLFKFFKKHKNIIISLIIILLLFIIYKSNLINFNICVDEHYIFLKDYPESCYEDYECVGKCTYQSCNGDVPGFCVSENAYVPYDCPDQACIEHGINCDDSDNFTVGSQVSNSIEGGIGEQEHSENINHPTLLNIYGEPLQKCKTGSNEPNKPGSWDLEGYCSEMGGGVHQICFDVTNERSDFSSVTGQSNWSEERVGNNHCMCLGAWALYKAKDEGDDNELFCDAIPEESLTSGYIDNWNTWNGNELSNQIIDGVDSLVFQCYNKQSNEELKKKLRDKYNILRNNYNIEWNSII